jgi:hypothetical protein
MTILTRKTFSTSRLAEFVSIAELAKQVGQPVELWPCVVLKELLDNSIDAAEESGAAPVIDINVGKDGAIVVADNGPGIPARPSNRFSTTRSAHRRAKPMCRRLAVPKATRSRRSWRWATCSTARSRAPPMRPA